MTLHFLSFPFTQDCGAAKCQQTRVLGGSFVQAEMKKNCPPPQREDESKSITSSVSQKVNPFSGKEKPLDRPAQSPVNKNRRPQVEKSSPQVQPRNISNLSFSRQKNPLPEKAKALDRPIPDCVAADIRGTKVVISRLYHFSSKVFHPTVSQIPLVTRWTPFPRELNSLQNHHTSLLPSLLKLKLWWLMLHSRLERSVRVRRKPEVWSVERHLINEEEDLIVKSELL